MQKMDCGRKKPLQKWSKQEMVKESAFHPNSESLTDCRRKTLSFLLIETKPGKSFPCFMSFFINSWYNAVNGLNKGVAEQFPKEVCFCRGCLQTSCGPWLICRVQLPPGSSGASEEQAGAACATLRCPVCGATIMKKGGETEAGRAFPSPVQNITSFKGRPGSPGPFDNCFAGMAAGKICEMMDERLGSSWHRVWKCQPAPAIALEPPETRHLPGPSYPGFPLPMALATLPSTCDLQREGGTLAWGEGVDPGSDIGKALGLAFLRTQVGEVCGGVLKSP